MLESLTSRTEDMSKSIYFKQNEHNLNKNITYQGIRLRAGHFDTLSLLPVHMLETMTSGEHHTSNVILHAPTLQTTKPKQLHRQQLNNVLTNNFIKYIFYHDS